MSISSSHPDASNPRITKTKRWNYDILLRVFDDLSLHDLARTSLVCRDWLPAAETSLYKEPFLDLTDRYASGFASTMRTRPDLRARIRSMTIKAQLSIFTDIKRLERLLDWISLISPYTIQKITFRDVPTSVVCYYLLTYPDIWTTRRLIVTGFYANYASVLQRCMEMPALESLSVLLPYTDDITMGNITPCLKRLSIIAARNIPQLPHILANPPSHLARCDLTIADISLLDAEKLIDALDRHRHSLRRLSIEALDKFSLPSLDTFVQRLSNLEHLCCGTGTYTPILFQHLPRSLRTLTLINPLVPHGLCVADIQPLLQCVERGECGLLCLRVVSWRDASEWSQFRDSCRQAGLDFEVTGSDTIDFLT